MKKALICLLFLSVGIALCAQQKYALVIGNGNYTGISKLTNPVNDANDVSAALQGLGFTVDKVLDGNLDQMESAISRLKNRLSIEKNSYGFFFYAGHGVQSNGSNYLLPVNANIPSENALKERAVSLQYMMSELNDAGNDLNIIVLDACRDNPFGWARSGNRGLALVSAPVGSIVMYATSANSTAADGDGRNGLFTSELLKNLKTPGLNVQELFNKTGQDVLKVSGGKQHPEISLRFFDNAYLGAKPVVVQLPKPEPAPEYIVPAEERPPEYIVTVPKNMVRIQGGTFTMGSSANEPERRNDETQHQVTVSSFYIGKYQVTQKEYQELMGKNPSLFKGDNLPVERVSWYDAVEYCNALSLKEGLMPAYTIDKDRSDANNKNENDTLRWLVTLNKNANGYRLPTEAEWEYACRAGTTTPFNTGNNITTGNANYNGNNPYNNNSKGEYRQKTTNVGSFSPNPFGLYDMHGNVCEWCWDWYGSYASGEQKDPTGAISDFYRVVRGGSWDDSGQDLRSAFRNGLTPLGSRDDFGFRLVRE